MDQEQVLKEFSDSGAILKGHFMLSSGLRSDTYLQCARVLMDAKRAERLCSTLAQKIENEIQETIDIVFSPAMGGVIVGYEMGRQLSVPAVFCERVDGEFIIRRGFEVPEGSNVLIVEDVVTTGKSSLEAIKCAESVGGKVIAEACLINRSGQENPLDIPLIPLTQVEVRTFDDNNIPTELLDVPAIKPGSRWNK